MGHETTSTTAPGYRFALKTVSTQTAASGATHGQADPTVIGNALPRLLDLRVHVHPLVLSGPAPWPSAAGANGISPHREGEGHQCDHCSEPWQRYCMQCGLRLLLLWLHSREWVSRRVESVGFSDDRKVLRRISVDFYVPDAAPTFRSDNAQYRLVPLAVMRRKSLVNFNLRDEEDRSVSLLPLRHTQALTESLLAAWAATLFGEENGFASTRRFIHKVVSGEQTDLVSAMASAGDQSSREVLAKESAPVPPVNKDMEKLLDHKRFSVILNRLADNWLLFGMVRANGQDRRVLRLHVEEPLSLRYRKPSYQLATHAGDAPAYTYSRRERLGRRFRQELAAIGLGSYHINFPVPAADSSASFHFELETPPGVRLVEAALVAGRPNNPTDRPSIDIVKGGSPTVGLHVADVPTGSLSAVQVKMLVMFRGWLARATLSCGAVTAVLAVVLWRRLQSHGSAVSPSDLPITVLVGLTSLVAVLVAQTDVRGVAARMLRWTRTLATSVAALPFVVALVFLGSPGDGASRFALRALLLFSCLVTVMMLVISGMALRRVGKAASTSPWEQGRHVPQPKLETTFDDAAEHYGLTRPSALVASPEGSTVEFEWSSSLEENMLSALHRALQPERPQGQRTRSTGQSLRGSPGTKGEHSPRRQSGTEVRDGSAYGSGLPAPLGRRNL
jgi:hypothetical protein